MYVMQLVDTTDKVEIIGMALGIFKEPPAFYLAWFDVDADDGRGREVVTGNIEEAMRFESQHAAMLAWATQSNVRPLRSDGKPNRPLTAYSISIIPYPGAAS
jgi:hypothetical protein